MSYYQKYRPEKISELDLTQARSAFLIMMGAGEVAHAYLLVGPRGSGKTSSARILARMVNCEKNYKNGKLVKKLNEPCGECSACVSIKNGSAVDVLEIDAASHRGIDDIRDLREKARLAPVALSRKVYIIDEVHMLTTEAFNALLKILEEPPEQVMFILCTTEAHKVPETIVSRCTRVSFTKAGREELVASLARAAEGEGLAVDKKALDLLAESVDGSFREGHKLLEQLALATEKITEETVRAGLRLAGAERVKELLMAVKEKQAAEVISIIRGLEGEGVEVLSLITKLLTVLRDKVSFEIAAGRQADRWEIRLIDRLIRVVPKLKQSPLPYLPLEMALVRAALGGRRAGATSKTVFEVRKEKEKEVEGEGNVRAVGEIRFEEVENGWQELLTRLTPRNHSTAGLLRSAKPKEIDDKFLTIEVFYKFHKEQLEQEARRNLIEEEVAKLWGPLSVKCILGERPAPRGNGAVRLAERVVPLAVGDEDTAKAAEEIFGS